MPILNSDAPRVGARLTVCAELLKRASGSSPRRVVADVGTDHGLLPVLLVSSGLCDSAYASDINPKPLEAAKRTVQTYGLSDRISIVLSDGLNRLPVDTLTDIVCAGMGGELIVRILSESPLPDGVTLILQPMTKPEILRKWLYEHGYVVEEETAVRDGRFVYSVMRAAKNGRVPNYPCDELYLYGGMIDPSLADGARYLETCIKRLRKAADGMLKGNADREREAALRKAADALEKRLNEGIGADNI